MSADTKQFSLVIGGPFHQLLSRLKLLGPDELPTRKAAFMLALVAWMPCAMMAAASYLVTDNAAALSFFSDYTAHTRNLLAISLMILAERSAHLRLNPLVYQFGDAGLIADEDANKYNSLLERADKRSSSTIVESVILIAVMLMAIFGSTLDLEMGVFPWDGNVVDGRAVYTTAGLWSHWVAKPLFQFLVLRWLWRFGVWGRLLHQFSKMRLKLTAFHPDLCGGLGFLSVFPMVFGGLIFALSSTVAAELVSEGLRGGVSYDVLQAFMVAWIAFVVFVFIGPLVAFLGPLYRLREHAIFELGRLASEHQAAFEQKWLRDDASGRDLLGSEDVSSASDLGPIAASPYSLRVIPIAPATAIHLVFTAGIPMLAVVASQMPLTKFFEFLKSILLL